MDSTRRTLLGGAAAATVAPALIGRAWAAEAGQPLPALPLVDLGASGAQVLEAIAATHGFFDGLRTPVLGFGQPFLGPVLRVRRGSTARVDVRNRLREPITVHWHGLHVPGAVDGGPHSPVAPGDRWQPSLEIEQPAATLWYHSHVHGRTGPQVYHGLAGMLIVDDAAAAAGLPSNWGVDDLPLIVQDRAFARDGRLLYSNGGPARMAGFRGDRIVVNGAIRPEAAVPAGVVRLRILNGSNARIYHLRFEDGRSLHLVGSDGGLLPRALARPRITLSPGERAEVLVDFGAGAARTVRLLSDADDNSPMAGMMGGMMGGMMAGGAQPEPVQAGGAFEVMRFVVDPARSAALRTLPERIAGAAPPPAFGEPVRRRRFVLDSHGGMMGGMAAAWAGVAWAAWA